MGKIQSVRLWFEITGIEVQLEPVLALVFKQLGGGDQLCVGADRHPERLGGLQRCEHSAMPQGDG